MSTLDAPVRLPEHPGISERDLFESRDRAEQGMFLPLFREWKIRIQETDAWKSGSTNFVWAAGDPNTARLLIVGEAPGPEEAQSDTRLPFVGLAGQTLSRALHLSGISRFEDVVLTNTVSLLPLSPTASFGRPTPHDMLLERPRLVEMARLLRPRAVVLLGKYALISAQNPDLLTRLVKDGRSFDDMTLTLSMHCGWHPDGMRGTFPCPVLVMYHPSYVLRCHERAEKSKRREHVIAADKISSEYLRDLKQLKRECLS